MAMNDDQVKIVIRQLMKTPGFSNLSQESKNRLINRAVQDKFGSIPHHENFLQQAIKNSGSAMNPRDMAASAMAGGPSLMGMATGSGTKNVEEGLPTGMQIAGNAIGGEVGLLHAGAPVRGGAIGGTIGRSVGEAGKQGIQAVLDKKPMDIGEFAGQTGLGAATETLNMPLAFAANKFLGKPAGDEFRGKTGSILGGLKDIISEKGGKISADKVIKVLQDHLAEIENNVQADPAVGRMLNDVIDEVKRVAPQKGGLLDPQDIMNATRRFDLSLKSLGVYGNRIPKDFKEAGIMGKARQYTSDLTQGQANDLGIGKSYSKAKSVFSKVAKDYPASTSKHGIAKNMFEVGGVRDLIAGNIPAAAGNIFASEAIGSQPLFRSIYNILKIGKALPGTTAEVYNYANKD